MGWIQCLFYEKKLSCFEIIHRIKKEYIGYSPKYTFFRILEKCTLSINYRFKILYCKHVRFWLRLWLHSHLLKSEIVIQVNSLLLLKSFCNQYFDGCPKRNNLKAWGSVTLWDTDSGLNNKYGISNFNCVF